VIGVEAGKGLAERPRSRTEQAVGYTAGPILKTAGRSTQTRMEPRLLGPVGPAARQCLRQFAQNHADVSSKSDESNVAHATLGSSMHARDIPAHASVATGAGNARKVG
jgi:hypothetical protein